MTPLLVVLAVVAVLVAVAGVAVAQLRGQERANQVVPGRPTRAPRSWAGSHGAEARLHRRLRDAVRALGGLDGVDLATRGEVERHVADLDDRLVAVASLPVDQRKAPLDVLAEQVAAVEEAVGAFATDGLDGATDPGAGLAALSERLDALAAAHAELDALEQQRSAPGPDAELPGSTAEGRAPDARSPATPADLDALAGRLDEEREARAGDAPAPPARPSPGERPQPGPG